MRWNRQNNLYSENYDENGYLVNGRKETINNELIVALNITIKQRWRYAFKGPT